MNEDNEYGNQDQKTCRHFATKTKKATGITRCLRCSIVVTSKNESPNGSLNIVSRPTLFSFGDDDGTNK